MALDIDFWRHSDRKSSLKRDPNQTVREIINIKKNIIQTIEEKQLGWFGHVMSTGHEGLVRNICEWESEGWRRRGRPRKTWISDVKVSMLNLCLTILDSLNGVLWHRRVFCKLVRWRLKGTTFS